MPIFNYGEIAIIKNGTDIQSDTKDKTLGKGITSVTPLFFSHQSKYHTDCSPEYISPFGHSLSKPLIVDDFFPYKEE